MQLGLDVEPVHIGEDGNDSSQGVEVLDKSLVEFVDESIIVDRGQMVGPLAKPGSERKE